MTVLEKILNDLLSNDKIKVCVDKNNPALKKAFVKEYERIYFVSCKGGNHNFSKAMTQYDREYNSLNLTNLCEIKGYYLRRGKRFIFAIKENILNLY